MHPAFSVIFLTTLIGAGQGLYLAVFVPLVFGELLPQAFLVASGIVAMLLLAGGLVASFFHLGHPERAWRAVMRWRTSWLSREVIVLPLLGVALFFWTVRVAQGDISLLLSVLAALLALALYLCTGMIYAAVKCLREWSHPFTVINLTLIGLASGAQLAAVLAAIWSPAHEASYVTASLWLLLAALLSRGYTIWRNLTLEPLSAARAIHVHHSRIRQISQGAMGGSYNTREFFHGQPAERVAQIRWAAIGLGFVVPFFLLALGAPALLAFLIHYLGIVAERWYFFAEVKHPQNLYYQSVA